MRNHTLKSIYITIVSFFIVVFLLEVYFHLFSPNKITPDLHQSKYNLPIVLRPNLDVKLDWSHGYQYPQFHLHTNSKHFLNDQEFQYKKPTNTFRILMLGDSIFMGLGITGNELFSKNLQDILNEQSIGKHVEVINFSGVAWSAIQFIPFLQNEGYKYNPDLVIISQGENSFRVKYNKLIQISTIEKEKTSTDKIKITLGGLEVNSLKKSVISNIWEWIRKLPYYVEISNYSQLLHRVRSKINNLWYKKLPQISQSKQLGYFLETNRIDITKNSIFSLNSDEFSIDPLNHSITFFAKTYNNNTYEAKANIALHAAAQIKISQILNSLKSKFVVIDIPTWQDALSIIKPHKTRILNSSLKNYHYLDPTQAFKKFQSKNIDIPLYFYDNNHLSPAGHKLVAILTYNFLVKNNLVPFQDSWKLIDPFMSKTTTLVMSANRRIENFIKTDNRSKKFRGLFYEAAGDYNLAKKYLVQYLTLENKDYETYYLLGRVLLYLNEFSAALESFKKSFGGAHIEIKRYKYAYDFTQAYKDGWENYDKKDLKKALHFAKKLEKLEGEFWVPGALLNFHIYQEMGDLLNAERILIKALTLESTNLQFLSLIASLKFKQKKYEDAINYSIQILQLNNNQLKALLRLGLSHANLGNKREANIILSKYLTIDPNNELAKKALKFLKILKKK
jgi:hypothetical protein